ncbi:SMI1/KNR4 family protein [Jeotgalibacillus sp. S-D1]|uniref:SMI1/KNR4 family protein n=1 Tax=Jeotgalibacillus sp. S-D1 TaxID=2552189 RepID=UPI00105A4882|nr:SMI1/KNR4 family protein [Jeotgalibacillus sp. S-D1]TDL32776.1 SMI1/KNR4 family protein [Jeotgalibacillus sp. S-D1]
MTIRYFRNGNITNIKDFEKKYSVNIPEDYREFLEKQNGGIVEKNDQNVIPVEDISEEITIDVLFGLNTGSAASNVDTWMDKLKDDLLDGAVIIGDDIMQGLIVMICEGEFSGIYYWDDAYNFEESDDNENTYWIADDFKSFIKKIN